MIGLRDYQNQARTALATRLAAGKRSLLTVLPTGTGKTVLFAAEVADRTTQGSRSLILAHRDELIEQPQEVLERTAPGLGVGIVKAERNEFAAQVVIASVQTLCRPERLDALRSAGPVGLIVTDEAHHSVADSYMHIYCALGAGAAGGPLHFGYTATPQRFDKAGLSSVFEEVAFARDIKTMVTESWLTEPRGRIVNVGIDLDGMRRNAAGDYSDASLDEAFTASVVRGIADAWWEHARERVTVAFTPSVRTAEMLAASVNAKAGAEIAAHVDGGTEPAKRRAILSDLKSDRIRFVANCGVLTEGFDAPNVACIVVARPTRSESLYTQMIGRGLRLWPTKADCLVLDVTGISETHSLIVLPSIFGLPVADMAGKSVSDVAEEVAESAKRRGIRLAQVEGEVDLLRPRHRWAWQEMRPGKVYAVDAGTDDEGNFRTVVVGIPKRCDGSRWVCHVLYHARRECIGRDVLFDSESERAQEDAFGAAETWLSMHPDALRLASADVSSWRATKGSRPATDAQIAALEKWRVNARSGLTMLQASDLLAARILRARLGIA